MNQKPSYFNISPKKSLSLMLKGFAMGCADVVPGISGGTVALILGIYEDFIESLKTLDLNFAKNLFSFEFAKAFDGIAWKFLLSLLFGIGTAIFTLAKLLSWLLEHKPILINAFFFGLIIATIPIIGRLIKKWSWPVLILICVSAFFSYQITVMVPINTPDQLWFLFLCGAIAICAMILPGISGSFILLLLGKYAYIISVIKNFDLIPLAVVGSGMIIGILTFVRVLSWLFKKYHDIAIAILTGFVIGSLNKIWPWKKTLRFMEGRHGENIPIEQINILPSAIDKHFFLTILMLVLGLAIAIILDRQGDVKKLN